AAHGDSTWRTPLNRIQPAPVPPCDRSRSATVRAISMNHDTLSALILGAVEGLTEFLPVSSTGHLILVGDLLGFQSDLGKLFEIVIQLGAILAVVVFSLPRLWRVIAGLGSDPGARRFAWAVIVAFLPAAVLGALLPNFIKTVF